MEQAVERLGDDRVGVTENSSGYQRAGRGDEGLFVGRNGVNLKDLVREDYGAEFLASKVIE